MSQQSPNFNYNEYNDAHNETREETSRGVTHQRKLRSSIKAKMSTHLQKSRAKSGKHKSQQQQQPQQPQQHQRLKKHGISSNHQNKAKPDCDPNSKQSKLEMMPFGNFIKSIVNFSSRVVQDVLDPECEYYTESDNYSSQRMCF